MRDAVNLGLADCSAAINIWDRLCGAVSKTRRLYLFADFDGTLSELVETPHLASLDGDPFPKTGPNRTGKSYPGTASVDWVYRSGVVLTSAPGGNGCSTFLFVRTRLRHL